jgi:hypothetical protein
LVYIILPIATISIFSVKNPSQVSWLTYTELSFFSALDHTSILRIGLINPIPNRLPKIRLFIVSVCNSDILISISININKNKIDTAPIYTNKYDIPIKYIPINNKYKDTNKNNPIRYKIDNMGFLLIITKIPNKINMNSKILIVNINDSFKLLVVNIYNIIK